MGRFGLRAPAALRTSIEGSLSLLWKRRYRLLLRSALLARRNVIVFYFLRLPR